MGTHEGGVGKRMTRIVVRPSNVILTRRRFSWVAAAAAELAGFAIGGAGLGAKGSVVLASNTELTRRACAPPTLEAAAAVADANPVPSFGRVPSSNAFHVFFVALVPTLKL